MIRGHCAVNLYQFPFHDFPISSGMLEHIDIRVPPGSFFDADPEAAISCSPLVGAMVFPLLGVALSKVMFSTEQRSLVCGFTSSSASAVMVAGTNQHGVRVTDFMGYPLNAYGLAARSDRDGIDVWGFPHGPWGKAPDVEDIESEFPLLHLYQKQQRDTCGFGKYRGGLGAAVGYVVYRTPAPGLHLEPEGVASSPPTTGCSAAYSMTVDPGYPGARGRPARADGGRRAAACRPTTTRWPAATRRWAGRSSSSTRRGGSGWSRRATCWPPAPRAAAATATCSNAIHRPWPRTSGPTGSATGPRARCSRVAYDPETLLVDERATGRCARAHRARRLEHGRPYAEFAAEWEQRRPPEDVLKYFGEWPSGAPNRDVVRI